jgi:hypothetical protein
MDERESPLPSEPDEAPPPAESGDETVGTGSAIALGCVIVTVVLILLGALFFVILWLVA